MSIKFNNLQNVKNTAYDTEKATFVDISLDMSFNNKDIVTSLDEAAIKNSLYVLFNTRPGENILNPNLGIDLRQELFQPLTESNGYVLASKIRTGITKFEPRVQVEQINVYVIPDELSYEIEITIVIPALKYRTKYSGIFNSSRFTVTSESRYGR